ncbi:MAG: trimeric autotransporter adhesin [Clostridiales bacterium]|nr:trimeric autotransporter adhesin [Clostridiales bacterium]
MLIKKMGNLITAFVVFFAAFVLPFAGIPAKAETAAAISSVDALKNISGSGSYYLAADITLSGEWTPIAAGFTGTLDGRGHVIKNLIVGSSSSVSSAGLFVRLGSSAVIKNLGFDNANVTGTSTAGVIAGSANDGAKILNCYAINSTVKINSDEVTGISALVGGNLSNVIVSACYYNSTTKTASDFNADNRNLGEPVLWKDGAPNCPTFDYITPFAAGSGTADAPFIISSASDMASLAIFVNNNMTYGANKYYTDACYKLSSNITLTSFVPIGTETYPFKGVFNGDGKIISGSVSANSDGYSGIFAKTDGATIKNLGVMSSASGSKDVGAIVAHSIGSTLLEKCYSTGAVSSSGGVNSGYGVGGLIGRADDSTKVLNCYGKGPINGGQYRGGIIGYSNSSTIENSYTTNPYLYAPESNRATVTNSYYADYANSDSNHTRTLAYMKKANFAYELNGRNAYGAYGAVPGDTPVLVGIGAGANVTSSLKQIKIVPPTNGTLKVYLNNEEVVNDEYVPLGSTLIVKATPATGYSLAALKIGDTKVSTSENTSITVDRDMQFSAEFGAYETYTIKVVKNAGGTVTPSDSTIKVKKGEPFTFTIVPDVDCRVQSVTYTGNTITVDGDKYTVGNVTRDETLTVKFVSKSEGIKETVVNADGEVIITAKSYDSLIDLLYDGNEGKTIKVDMSKSTTLDKKTLEALKGLDIDLLLDMKDYTWRINGESVKSTDSGVNLGVTMNASSIDSKYMSKFNAFKDRQPFDLNYNGAFPFTGYLTFKASGTNTIGKYVTLFYFNESTKAFETIDSKKVNDDGTVTFRFKHASSYVAVTADRPLTTSDLAVGASFKDNAKPIVMKTSDIMFASVLLLAVAAGGAGLFFYIRKDAKTR